MAQKLIIVEEGGSLFIEPIEIDDNGNVISHGNWALDFIVDQTNLIDMHKAFEMNVKIFKRKRI